MGIDSLDFEGAVEPETLDGIFLALSNATRRHLLAAIEARGKTVSVDEIVEDLSAKVADGDERMRFAVSNDIAVELHHVHLPKLEDVGLIEVSEGPTGRTIRGTRLLDRVATGQLFSRSVDWG